VKKKVIVLGLDGLEPSLVEAMLQRGELPHFQKLREMGSYRRLQTTYPAQTPVAWSSFVTGTNPGGHGIFDFICRDPQRYLPDIALSRFEKPKSVLALPKVVSRRKGTPIWQHLTNAGVPSIVLRCPVTFPAEPLMGKMISGVGVPDVRGSQGCGTFYTQDGSVQAKEHEQVIRIQKSDQFSAPVIGPRNTKVNPAADVTAEINVRVDRAARKLIIKTGGTPAQIEIAEQQWSPWVRLKFKISMLQSVTGIVRFFLRQLDPVEFYASPVNFDPAAPPFPVSSPTDYGKKLSEEIGLFSTLGMAEDHTGLNNGRFDEEAYVAQCKLIFEERERMMMHELGRFSEGFFFTLFDTPDRVQHMLWKFIDPEHPCFDRDMASQLGKHIQELYLNCDRLLGRALEKVDENTLLIVLSDHGFNSFRRAFDTNTWLWENGLLALKDSHKPSEELGDSFSQVDWSKTYAYALGLGGIYLNVKGREGSGIVEEGSGEAERVRRTIQESLASYADKEAGKPAIRDVSRKEEMYSGPYVNESPDLLVNFHPGYRVSWASSLGGFANSTFENNTRRWSGDHIIDPDAVPGILFMNCAANAQNHARMVDMAPTILAYLGVTPKSMEGTSLVQ